MQDDRQNGWGGPMHRRAVKALAIRLGDKAGFGRSHKVAARELDDALVGRLG